MQGMCIMLCTIQAGKVLRVAVTEGVKGATADFVRFHCPLAVARGHCVKVLPIQSRERESRGSKTLWLVKGSALERGLCQNFVA